MNDSLGEGPFEIIYLSHNNDFVTDIIALKLAPCARVFAAISSYPYCRLYTYISFE
jgi:hypothetical protein